MNREVITNALDLFAFLLVTVDLYGRHRLHALSERLRAINYRPKLIQAYWLERDTQPLNSRFDFFAKAFAHIGWANPWRRTRNNCLLIVLAMGMVLAACLSPGLHYYPDSGWVYYEKDYAYELTDFFEIFGAVPAGLAIVLTVLSVLLNTWRFILGRRATASHSPTRRQVVRSLALTVGAFWLISILALIAGGYYADSISQPQKEVNDFTPTDPAIQVFNLCILVVMGFNLIGLLALALPILRWIALAIAGTFVSAVKSVSNAFEVEGILLVMGALMFVGARLFAIHYAWGISE